MPVSHKTHKRRTPEELREAIRATELMNVLEAHALDEKLANGKKTTKLDRTRIEAAKILLKKCLPDLTSVAVSGEMKGTMTVNVYLPDNGRKLTTADPMDVPPAQPKT